MSPTASRYRPARFRGGPAPLDPAARHLVGRFSYGVTPGLAADVRRAGGARRWFEEQLEPSRIQDPATATRAWWPSLSKDAEELWQRQVREVEFGWEAMANYQRWLLIRRLTSRRQILEVMTEFWENHLNVPANGDAQFTWRRQYGETLRAHALGRFDELLTAAVTHPAMLIYLDGAVSTSRSPNENLGRELLELHTVGRDAYDEDDVKDSARILTGWTLDLWRTWRPAYVADDHATGPVRVLGFHHANRDPDGRAVTRAYLRYLAHHPATARRIARRLAVKFVSDDPPGALVDRLARVYLRHDTAIRPVLRELLASPAFRRSRGEKVRDPAEDVVATYRALGVRLLAPSRGSAGGSDGANAVLWQTGDLGLTPVSWPRPDGPPLDSTSWSSPSRLVGSMRVHYSLAGRWWPTRGTRYRTPEQWLPRKRLRFDELVDHLSVQLLARRSTATLLEACCQAVDVRPHEMVDADHGLVRWGFPRLLVTFLDSPAHLTR